jgi:hypothetical protein
VAMLVLVTDVDPSVSLDTETAERLADIGVTNVAIVADDSTQAIVLEGWALDPATAVEPATSALRLGPRHALRPVLQTLLPRPNRV